MKFGIIGFQVKLQDSTSMALKPTFPTLNSHGNFPTIYWKCSTQCRRPVAHQRRGLVLSSIPWWLDTGTHQEHPNTPRHSSTLPPSSGLCCAAPLILHTYAHARCHSVLSLNRNVKRNEVEWQHARILISESRFGTFTPRLFSTCQSCVATMSVGERQHARQHDWWPSVRVTVKYQAATFACVLHGNAQPTGAAF